MTDTIECASSLEMQCVRKRRRRRKEQPPPDELVERLEGCRRAGRWRRRSGVGPGGDYGPGWPADDARAGQGEARSARSALLSLALDGPPHMATGRPMSGWIVPPPGLPVKSEADLPRARSEDRGARAALWAPSLRAAARGDAHRASRGLHPSPVPRPRLRGPLPLPGERATISCPHSYPLFYEPLGLNEGHRFLEVGVGSGYGTALAREVVGPGARSWPSTSTRQRSPSHATTWNAPATPTSSSSTATGPPGTPSTHRTTRSASRRPAPTCRRRSSRSSRRGAGSLRPFSKAPPATHPPRDDRQGHPKHDHRGSAVFAAARTLRRRRRSAMSYRTRRTVRCSAVRLAAAHLPAAAWRDTRQWRCRGRCPELAQSAAVKRRSMR